MISSFANNKIVSPEVAIGRDGRTNRKYLSIINACQEKLIGCDCIPGKRDPDQIARIQILKIARFDKIRHVQGRMGENWGESDIHCEGRRASPGGEHTTRHTDDAL